jgi:hypothetical protein
LTEEKKTKRKVDLVSSHSDDEDNDGHSLLSDDEPTGLEIPHSSIGLGTHTLPFKLKPGENSVYYEEYIPDVDHNEYR